MQCLLKMLTLLLLSLSLSSCVSKDGVWQFQPIAAPVDSYCQVYQPVVVEKGDGSITAKTGVKKRILANELTYRDQCPNGGK